MADDDDQHDPKLAAALSAYAAKEAAVNKAVVGGKPADALTAALGSLYLSSKQHDIKQQQASLVLKALAAFKSDADMAAAISALSSDAADDLMKIVYKCMSGDNAAQSAVLLKTHAQVVNAHGNGPIIRAITDRRTAQ